MKEHDKFKIINIMLIILLIIILIIVILLIINQAFSNHADKVSFVKSDKFIFEPYNLEELEVKKIGICLSVTTFLPYEIYSVCHEDILCYCSDGNWYMLAEIYEKEHASRMDHIIGIRKVEPVKKLTHLTFNYGGYKYTCFKLYKPDCYVNLKFVYEVFSENFAIPYHILKNNCHHLCKHVINVITNRKSPKTIISEFESLKYVNRVIMEIFNDDFIE